MDRQGDPYEDALRAYDSATSVNEGWAGVGQDPASQFQECTRILYAASNAVHSIYLGYRNNRNKHSLDFDSDYKWNGSVKVGDGSVGDGSTLTDFVDEVHTLNNIFRVGLMQGYVKPEFLSLDTTRTIDSSGYSDKDRSLYNLIHWAARIYDRDRQKYNLTRESLDNITRASQMWVAFLDNELSMNPKSRAERGLPTNPRHRKQVHGPWRRIDHWREDHKQRKPIGKYKKKYGGKERVLPAYGDPPQMESRPLYNVNLPWRKNTTRKIYRTGKDTMHGLDWVATPPRRKLVFRKKKE